MTINFRTLGGRYEHCPPRAGSGREGEACLLPIGQIECRKPRECHIFFTCLASDRHTFCYVSRCGSIEPLRIVAGHFLNFSENQTSSCNFIFYTHYFH